MKTLLMLLLLSAAALAQTTEKAVVTDNTDPQSPVALVSNMTCTETVTGQQMLEKGDGSAVITNVSQRNIMAVVVALTYHCIRALTNKDMYQHDFFFKKGGLTPGDTLPIPLEEGISGLSSVFPPPVPSFVTTKVVYVQYDDGTFWGDPNAKASMDLQRQEERAFYSQLASPPSEADFVAAMNAPKPGTSEFPAAHPVKMAYSQSGFASALAIVNDRLTLANNRYATGKF
jgi:hypothetical protein